MREWVSPHAGKICSGNGNSLRSARVPNHIMGPSANEIEFHGFLLSSAPGHGFDTAEEYIEARVQANSIRAFKHQIMFTHSDFKAHNPLVGEDGHLSGISTVISWMAT